MWIMEGRREWKQVCSKFGGTGKSDDMLAKLNTGSQRQQCGAASGAMVAAAFTRSCDTIKES